jgi:hypothetical protein
LKHNPEAHVRNKGSTQGPRLQIKSDIRETNVINNAAYSKLFRENIYLTTKYEASLTMVEA